MHNLFESIFMPDYPGLCERLESGAGWPCRHPLQQLPQEVSSPPSWRSVYKTLVLLRCQLRAAGVSCEFQPLLGTAEEPWRAGLPPRAFPFVSYRTDKVRGLGFPSETQGAEKEQEGKKSSAWQSLVSSCALSGPSAGSLLCFRGDASRLSSLQQAEGVGLVSRGLPAEQHPGLLVKCEVSSGQVRPGLNSASAPYHCEAVATHAASPCLRFPTWEPQMTAGPPHHALKNLRRPG